MKLKLLLLLLSAILLFACAGDGGSGISDTKPAVTSETEQINEVTEAADKTVAPDLPPMNFDGKEFVVLARLVDSGYADWTAIDIAVEEQNGAPINDAVYLRNVTLEDRYNFSIRVEKTGTQDSYNVVTKILLAGDDSYDVVAIKGSESAQLGVGGFSIDLKSLDYIDLDREYWSHNVNDVMSVNNKLYSTVGDISIIDNYGIRCLYFNKDILNDHGLDDPYALVKSGKWTIDKMAEMGAVVNSDINGDGVMGTEDRYETMAQRTLGTILSIAGGVKIVDKDKSDSPVLAIDNERSINVINRMREYTNNKDRVYMSDDWASMLVRFNNGLSMFYAEVLLHIETMRGYEMEIGLLPVPKYDESQEVYWQFLDSYCCNFYSIPITNTSPDDAAFFLEAMSAESMNTLTPAFYDICLNGKYLRDEESSEMLDIILESYVVEFSDIFKLSIYQGLIDNILKDVDAVSFFAASLDKAQTELNNLIEKYSVN